jgi:Spy/CpxP family protein refolding chaperone
MSRPNRVRLFLVLAFALTLSAGVVAGIGFARANQGASAGDPPTKPAPTSPSDRVWMADQLKLDPQQREQVAGIWRDAPHDKVRELDGRRRALFKEREEALAALYTLQQKADRERISREFEAKFEKVRKEREEAVAALYSPDQKAKREQVSKEFAVKMAEVGKEKDKLLQPMVDRTRAVLTEEQRKRFDAMIARGGPDRGGPDRGGPNRGGGGHRENSPGGRPVSGPSTHSGDRGGDHPPLQ